MEVLFVGKIIELFMGDFPASHGADDTTGYIAYAHL